MKQIVQEVKSFNDNINFFTFLKGLLVSYIVTIPFFILFAFILTFTDFPENFIKPTVLISTIVSILIGGVFVSKKARSQGWLNGAISGVLYMILLYLIGSIVLGNFDINSHVLSMLAVGAVAGAAGGVFGINLRSRSRNRK
ncbi:MAG TPA: TIGR04086 family membrane protein [Clostridia bacterium]